MVKCSRCGKETAVSIMSYFNTDIICPDCEKKEKNHPDYSEAVKREIEECKKGNFNYQGIGKPTNL